METPKDSKHEARARAGTGASIGSVLGALLTAVFSTSPLPLILGTAVGAIIGGLIGTRIRSQMPQFFWIEYPGKIGVRIVFTSLPFLIIFPTFIYLIKSDAEKPILTIFLAASSAATLLLIYSIGSVIAGLDDVLKNLLLEAVGIGFGTAVFLLLTLGMVNLVFPFWSDWLVSSIIVMGSMLVGRIVVAWKYR